MEDMSNFIDARPSPPGHPFAGSPFARSGEVTKKAYKTRKLVLVCLYAACYALLATLYVFYTSPTWSYMGLDLSINYTKIVVSLFLFFFFVAVTPSEWSARAFFLNMILTAYFLPAMVLYGFSDRPTEAVVILSLAIGIVYIFSAISVPRLRIFAIYPRLMLQGLLALSLALLLTFFVFGGFRNFNLDYSRVYEFRDVASESLPGIFEYLSSFFTKAIIPFGIAIGLWHRRYASVVAFVAISIILFGLTSHKGMAIIPFLSIGVFMLLSRRPGYATLLSGVVALLFALAIAVAANPNMGTFSFWGQIETIFVRRALFIPALVDFNYIDFFTGGAKYNWSSSKLTLGLIDVPYNGLSAPLLIGTTYFGAETSANTGFIGSGFAQAGILGVIAYSIGVGLIIALFQTCSRYLGIPLVATATVGLFTAMIQSTDFVTLFLTNGLLPALVILALLRDQDAPPPRGAGASRRVQASLFRKGHRKSALVTRDSRG